MRYTDLLLEAQNYEQMFSKLFKLLDLPYTEVDELAVDVLVYAKDEIDQRIKYARLVLKKSDRITWYLKHFRIGMVEKYLREITRLASSFWEDQAKLDQFQQTKVALTSYHEQLLVDYRKWTGETYDRFEAEPYLLSNLEHFLSLPIPQIQNAVFSNQSAHALRVQFAEYESEWKKHTEDTIPHDPEDGSEILIDFHNGWCWLNLNKPYCPKEGDAMGHCGNSPRSNTGDTILSLRKRVEHDGQVYWKPHLTFILDPDHELSEMKGRGNDKPAKKYHEMIVALLKHDIVQGIVGGGYLPENNFSMTDLEPELRDELMDEKPVLGDAYHYWASGNYDETVLAQKIKEECYRLTRLHTMGIEDGNVILDEWSSAAKYVDDFYLNIRDEGWSEQALREVINLEADNVDEDIDAAFEEPDVAQQIQRHAGTVEGFQVAHHDDLRRLVDVLKEKVEAAKQGYLRKVAENLTNDCTIASAQVASNGVALVSSIPDFVAALREYAEMKSGEGDYYDYGYALASAHDSQSWICCEHGDQQWLVDNVTPPAEFRQRIKKIITKVIGRFVKQRLLGGRDQLRFDF